MPELERQAELVHDEDPAEVARRVEPQHVEIGDHAVTSTR